MSEVEKLMLETLKKIQADTSILREDVSQMKMRISLMESGIARIARSEISEKHH